MLDPGGGTFTRAKTWTVSEGWIWLTGGGTVAADNWESLRSKTTSLPWTEERKRSAKLTPSDSIAVKEEDAGDKAELAR